MWFLNVLLIGAVSGNERLLREGYSRRLTKMAAQEYTLRLNDNLEKSVVFFPHITDVAAKMTEVIAEKVQKKEKLFNFEDIPTITCDWGEGPDYWRFAPQFKGAALPGKGKVTFANHCYHKVTIEILATTENSVELGLESWSPSGVCYDTYFIAILNRVHLTAVDFLGTKKITFANLTSSEVFDVETNGVRVFTFCDGIEDLLKDVMMTVELFAGGFGLDPLIPFFGSHTTEEMEKSNVEFISKVMNYTMEKRTTEKINIQESDIHSGDFLAVLRLDGLDEIIMWGTGGRVGHSTMALWVEENGTRELYVVESQAGWYWPRAGLQMNKFSQWIVWAENASFNVAVLPLRQEVREIFDEKAVYEWFKTVEGMPYGYHNFMFGWIDTADQNLPPILSPELLTVGFSLVEEIIPASIMNIYGEAMNKRLGTFGLKIADLQVVAEQQGRSLLDVQTDVEMDGWWYSDGYAYVCSSFVLAMYKEAGILGSLPVQGTEFTPKDVYSLSIFDRGAVLPNVCTAADPTLPYCQIIGKYRIDLGSDYASIPPYANMNEHCPSVCPNYVRPSGC